jgi:2-haloacid dehalogenase
MPPTLVFDVNETLLDLSALDAPFDDAFGSPDVRAEWFAQVLQSALVHTVLDTYADFSAIAAAALDMIAARHDRSLSEAEQTAILDTVRALPPHPDVPDALDRLAAADIRLAALSNGTPDVLHAQLAHANLTSYFDEILSAHAVRRFKPAPDPYHMAMDVLDVAAGDMGFVAAHTWDVAGAMQAGCPAVLLMREGVVPDPLALPPTRTVPNLHALADLMGA